MGLVYLLFCRYFIAFQCRFYCFFFFVIINIIRFLCFQFYLLMFCINSYTTFQNYNFSVDKFRNSYRFVWSCQDFSHRCKRICRELIVVCAIVHINSTDKMATKFNFTYFQLILLCTQFLYSNNLTIPASQIMNMSSKCSLFK